MLHKLKIFTVILLTLFLSANMLAQEKAENDQQLLDEILDATESIYEIDQRLANGTYMVEAFGRTEGHPYYVIDEYYPGDLVYRGVTFNYVPLKYDVFEQRLLIKHESDDYQVITLLINEYISSFTLYGEEFRKIQFDGMDESYYKAIKGEGPIQCFYHESKIREEQSQQDGKMGYLFRDNPARKYIYFDGSVKRYKNNSSFAKALPEDIRDASKKYLKQNKKKIRKLDEKTMLEVVKHCEQLYLDQKGGAQ